MERFYDAIFMIDDVYVYVTLWQFFATIVFAPNLCDNCFCSNFFCHTLKTNMISNAGSGIASRWRCVHQLLTADSFAQSFHRILLCCADVCCDLSAFFQVLSNFYQLSTVIVIQFDLIHCFETIFCENYQRKVIS